LVSAESSAALKDEHHLPIRHSAEFTDRRLNHGFGHVTHRNLHKVGNCLQRRTPDLADALLISGRGPTAIDGRLGNRLQETSIAPQGERLVSGSIARLTLDFYTQIDLAVVTLRRVYRNATKNTSGVVGVVLRQTPMPKISDSIDRVGSWRTHRCWPVRASIA
jgi:hypothetical protein